MTRFGAIIFDLDGVLIESSLAHEAAYKQAFARFPGLEWSYSDLAGMRTDEAIKNILDRANIKVTAEVFDEVVTEKRKLAFEFLSRTKPVERECVPVLERLAKEFKLGIGTSASRRMLDFFLDLTGTAHLFDITVCGNDVPKAKPDPEIYLRCAKQIGEPAERCVVIEDSLVGIQSAKAAGTSVIWMDRGEFKLPVRIAVKAVIRSLRELERNV